MPLIQRNGCDVVGMRRRNFKKKSLDYLQGYNDAMQDALEMVDRV